MSALANEALANLATPENCAIPTRSTCNPLGVSGVNNRDVGAGSAFDPLANPVSGDSLSRTSSLKPVFKNIVVNGILANTVITNNVVACALASQCLPAGSH